MSKPWSYDRIASIYQTDMGQSMPFDDVGWYRNLCLSDGGKVLELGCGTGRILRPLLAAGIDAIGVDRSLPMLVELRRSAAETGMQAEVAQMDLAALGLCTKFRTILAPYSLVTYLTEPESVTNLIAQASTQLDPGGRLVLDAFVPQAVSTFADFRLDYCRPHGNGMLERHKRITAHADGRNRIERRYRILDSDNRLLDEIHTDETIRPYRSDQLIAIAGSLGWNCSAIVWDYNDQASADGARFATLSLQQPQAG
jgi:SAM-dependent methyltransferase